MNARIKHYGPNYCTSFELKVKPFIVFKKGLRMRKLCLETPRSQLAQIQQIAGPTNTQGYILGGVFVREKPLSLVRTVYSCFRKEKAPLQLCRVQ